MARNKISLTCIWICILVATTSSEPQNIFSIYGKSVTLHCPLQSTSGVEWYDWVYNTLGDTPATIYKDGVLNEDQYHAGRFTVDPDNMDLKITDLMEDDVGKYFCRTSSETEHVFDLSLGKSPECQGHVSDLRAGEQTNLVCTMEYTGNPPKVEWLRAGEVIEKMDKTEIGKAKHVVAIDVVPDMDKQTFTCQVAVGAMREECDLTFDVKYGVQDLKISPEKAAYSPGSEFMCSAKGNPVPTITVTLPDGEIKTASPPQQEVKVIIPSEWEGLTKSISCEAKNLEDGLPKSEKYNFTFTVSSKADPVAEGEGAASEGDDETPEKKTQMAGIVAGIVIGAVVLVIIIIAVVCVKKRQSKPPKGSKPVPTKEDGKGDMNA